MHWLNRVVTSSSDERGSEIKRAGSFFDPV